MEPIRKKIVTDEQQRPVAVQVDYEDWLKIEQALGLKKSPSSDEEFATLLDATAGIWKEERRPLRALADEVAPYWEGGDGLEYQRRIREEWARAWDPDAQNDEDE